MFKKHEYCQNKAGPKYVYKGWNYMSVCSLSIVTVGNHAHILYSVEKDTAVRTGTLRVRLVFNSVWISDIGC